MSSSDLDIEATVLSKMPRKGLWRAILAAGLACLVALALWWWSRETGQTAQAYIITPASNTDVTVVVTATGTVEPTNSVDISSALSGTVQSVDVDFNDMVTQGQVLAPLNIDRLEATLEHARATLVPAEARLALANATMEKARQTNERTLHCWIVASPAKKRFRRLLRPSNAPGHRSKAPRRTAALSSRPQSQ